MSKPKRPKVPADEESTAPDTIVDEAGIVHDAENVEALEDLVDSERRWGEDQPLRTIFREHAPSSPVLSAGDVDAAWDRADSGEETVGGSSPTPDQDRVDELGAAVGLSYDDLEPLHTTDKVAERDQKRWELDPRSADDAAS